MTSEAVENVVSNGRRKGRGKLTKDDLRRFITGKPARAVMWAREIDGSWHACAKGDPGAVQFVEAL